MRQRSRGSSAGGEAAPRRRSPGRGFERRRRRKRATWWLVGVGSGGEGRSGGRCRRMGMAFVVRPSDSRLQCALGFGIHFSLLWTARNPGASRNCGWVVDTWGKGRSGISKKKKDDQEYYVVRTFFFLILPSFQIICFRFI